MAEDPSSNLFTEAFTFFDGSYTVLPGLVSEATFTLRNICKGLFLFAEKFPNQSFVTRARDVIAAILAISDEMAKRAGLSRAMKPVPAFRAPVTVPAAPSFTRLKQAVSFNVSEATNLLRKQRTNFSALAPLIAPLGSVRFDDYHIDNGELLSKPIIRADDELTVALPGMLLPAAWNEVIRLAIEMGLESLLAERYKLAVWDTI